MPVDLSKIGLEGQESFYRRMNSAAQSKIMAANADAQALENEHTRKINELNTVAQGKLSSIMNREPQPMEDPEEFASRMDSLSSPLKMVGEVFMQGGATEEAMEFFKAASEIDKRESDIQNDVAKDQQNRLENIIKGADVVGRFLGTAKNEDEWQFGLDQIEKAMEDGVFVMDPEHFEQIRQLPFTPDGAAFFKERAMSAAQQANVELREITNDRLERIHQLNSEYKERSTRLSEQRLAEQKRHNRAMEKNSGTKPVTAPNKDQLKAARVALEAKFGADGDLDKNTVQFQAATNYVASQAMQIVRENKAIDYDTALRQAMMRAERSGILSRNAKLWRDDELIFASGKLPESAAPIPVKKDGTPDRGKLKKDHYYITSRGSAKWDGSQFVME